MSEISKNPRLKIDIDGWDVDDWGDEILKAVTVERTKYGLTVELDLSSEQFHTAARKIATAAVEEFVHMFETNWKIGPDGVILTHDEWDGGINIHWDDMRIEQTDEAFAALQEFIDERKRQMMEDRASEEDELEN